MLKSLISVFLFIGLCFGSFVIEESNLSANNSFDFYVYTQQYEYSVSSNFTIHGMWAEDNNGGYPSFCPGAAWNENLLTDLIPEMKQVWVSEQGANQDASLWQHEWEKHGTCSTFDEVTFFQNVLKLYPQFDIINALAASKIIPSSAARYTLAQISQAIKSNIGGIPVCKCSGTSLQEIAVCVTKDLQLMDCPVAAIGTTYFSCPKSGIEFY
eukprot:TRINITY_DN1681_c0_g1_i1.p1 TRINITY_DN1681_c0_g1~~TRINITY_DN1681_c0_g1_i1.p1  ORF type:complete len:225 (+),score=61.29 TRINITY_DN1681_c0_g1_i1:41-676(+)